MPSPEFLKLLVPLFVGLAVFYIIAFTVTVLFAVWLTRKVLTPIVRQGVEQALASHSEAERQRAVLSKTEFLRQPTEEERYARR